MMSGESTIPEYQRADQMLQNGQLRDAQVVYRELCEKHPADPQCWHVLGAICGMLGEMSEAERYARRAIAIAPDFAAGYFNLGTALLNQGKLDEAESCFRETLRREPGDARAHNNLGNALRAKHQMVEAEQCFREALRLQPANPDVLVNLGAVLRERGIADEAIRCFGDALQLNPDHVDALCNLGNAVSQGSEPEYGIAYLEHAARLAPTAGHVWAQLGTVLVRLKRFDAAADACRKALELDPERADSWYNLGCVYRDAGDRAQAEPLFREALKRDPNLEEARYFLAWWGAEEVPPSAPPDYVKDLFDGYADKFDSHLTGNLEYRTPELLAQAVRDTRGAKSEPMHVLDLGCGTGLAGVALRDSIRHLVGVDLSPKMIEKARARGIYDELVVGDVMAPLEGVQDRYELIVSADVFVYLGNLSSVFGACARALRSGGLFALSVETAGNSSGFELRNSGRYAHGDAYIKSLAKKAGFEEAVVRDVVLRKEKGEPMAGRIYVLRKYAVEH